MLVLLTGFSLIFLAITLAEIAQDNILEDEKNRQTKLAYFLGIVGIILIFLDA